MPIAGKREEPVPTPRRFKPTFRPRATDEHGRILPTKLEIAEGKAHKIAKLHPEDTEALLAWKAAHDALWREEGAPCVSRCVRCHVLRFGREWRAPCGFCGLVPDRDSISEIREG